MILKLAALALFWALFAISQPASAQAPDAPDTKPSFTVQSLSEEIEVIKNRDGLSEEQINRATELLQTASTRLSEIPDIEAQRATYLNDIETAPDRLEELNGFIEDLREQLAAPPAPAVAMIGEAALYELEQKLIQKESELATVQSELDGYKNAMQSISIRQTAAPRELTAARTGFGDVTSALSEVGQGELDVTGAARRKSLQARRHFRTVQIATLESEIASLPARQQILSARINLANLRTEILSREVQSMQDRTGRRRLNEALDLVSVEASRAASLAAAHPIVKDFAGQNVELAEQVATAARDDSDLSRRTANVREALINVENDLTAANELVSLGRLDRKAGETLRRLSNQLTPLPVIRVEIDRTQSQLANATRERVIAQERIRELPTGPITALEAKTLSRPEQPVTDALTEADLTSLQELVSRQRDLLQQVASTATTQISDISELQTVQNKWLSETTDLQTVLNENLLWVPNIPAMDFSWPATVVKGTLLWLSPRNLQLISTEFMSGLRALWPIAMIVFLLIFGLLRARGRLWADIINRGDMVGRVLKDSAWHTPIVILNGILIALPIPLTFLFIGLVFAWSDSPDVIITDLTDGFIYLSIFSLIFLTWLVWDRDGSLLGTHFKLSDDVRKLAYRQLRWFIPVVGLSSAVLATLEDTATPDIYQGPFLLSFIVTSLALAFFAFRLLWGRQKALAKLAHEDGLLTKFRGPIAMIIIGLPIIAAGLAAAGYLESANELVWKFFLTAIAFALTYVVYAAIRRVIIVAQRQIKYQQAVERREATIKARQEQARAEEAGEELPPPPPLDTSEIDVSSMTRQSSQLLWLFTVTGFAVLMWWNWSGLLPALSIFDGFVVWEYTTGILDEAGNPVLQSVTLWNILQALVIMILTFFGAKNLPGFLEIFILNRLGVESGTRYAVTTIAGYIITSIGLVIIFRRLGLRGDQLKWVAGGLSLGIGIGLQKIVANFVSGLIILFERPVRIGDFVTIGDQSGTVSRIKIRATTLIDLDNREILIPNEALISERVTNWTLSNSTTRLTVHVGVAYGSDTDQARDIILDVIKANAKILSAPPPQVFFLGFGASSLDFEIRVFLKQFEDRFPVKHALHTEINRALAKAGITIPFPQTDLNIVSQDIPLQIQAQTKPKPKPKPKTKPKPQSKTS